MITAYEQAMSEEGIAEELRVRVMNRVMFGDPESSLGAAPQDVFWRETVKAGQEFGGVVAHDLVTDEEGRIVGSRMHAPGTDEPVFDDRGFEVENFPVILDSDDVVFPLIARCWCGQNLRQRVKNGAWEH
jgi:hypothetical protein